MVDTKENTEDTQDGSEFDLNDAIENAGGVPAPLAVEPAPKEKKTVKGKQSADDTVVTVKKEDLDALMAGYKRLEAKVASLDELTKPISVDGEEPLRVNFRMYKGQPITKFTHSYNVEYGEGIGRYTIPHVDVFVHGSDEKITMRTEDFYQLERKEYTLAGDTATAIIKKSVNVGTGYMNESKYDEGLGEMVSTGRKIPNKVMQDKLVFKVMINGEETLVEDAYINA